MWIESEMSGWKWTIHTHTCRRLGCHLVLRCPDHSAEERPRINVGATPFDANGVRNECLLLFCNCGSLHGPVLFLQAPPCLSTLSCCDTNVFPSPPSFVVSWKVLPGILQKHCCILPDKNTGKGQTDVPSPLSAQVTHTHTHTHTHTDSAETEGQKVSGSNGWVLMLGNGCSVGWSHLSVCLILCVLQTSVSS